MVEEGEGSEPVRGQAFKSGRNKRFFPKHSETQDRPTKSGPGVPWVREVTDEDILYLIRRDELAFKTAMKWAGAVFNKWLTVGSDVPALKEGIEKKFEDLNVKDIFKQGYLLSKTRGYCLILLGFKDTSESSMDEPEGVSDLVYLHAIPRSAVHEIHQDEDPTSDTYGEITAYTLNIPTGTTVERKKFPASRFIHWKNPFVDDDPEGISMFVPLFDKYSVKKNLDFAMGQVPKTMARPIPILGCPDDADKEEVDAAELSFKQFTTRSQYVYPLGYKPELLATNIALNPTPYTDYVLGTIAAGSVGSKVALLGTEAGAVTGSEVNQQEWYGAVSDDQRNYVNPKLRELVIVMQKWGILPPGDFWFEWEALYEMDDVEKADITLKNAQALQALAGAINMMALQGFEPVLEEDALAFVKDSTKLILPAMNALVEVRPRTGKAALPGRAQARAPYLPEAAQKQLYRIWEVKSQDIENRTNDNFQAHITVLEREFMDALRVAWEKNIGRIGADPSMPAGRTDEPEFYEEMDEWGPTPASLRKFKADLLIYLEEVFAASSTQTLENLGVSPVGWKLKDTKTVQMLKAESSRYAKNTLLDMHKGAMVQIAEGMRAGEHYAQVNDRIAKSFKEFNKGIPNTVQKIMHTVSSEARFDTLEQRGVKKIVFSTSQDAAVRPEHAALEGVIMTREEAMPYLSDFGCRCTPVPVTAWDEAVEANRREQEEAEQGVV